MENASEDIKKLEQKISELQQKEKALAKGNKKQTEFARASRIGLRVSVELFSGIIIGAGIGYLLDNLFECRPWMLVLFLFFGGAAGILNVYRLAKNEDELK